MPAVDATTGRVLMSEHGRLFRAPDGHGGMLEALERVNKNPLHYQEVHLQVRRALVHRFPYGIFYVVMENRIIVIAVLHEARNPERWQSRI